MTAKSRASFQADKNLTIVTNTTGAVTAAVLRAELDNLADSAAFPEDLGAFAPKASPAFTGTPTAPTPAPGNNSTAIATTAFIAATLAALVNAAPATLDTLNELAAALGNDPNFATTISAQIALKAPLASPALTGNPTATTQAPGNNSTRIATTAFVAAAIAGLSGGGGVTSGTAAPTVAPTSIGAVYVNTAAGAIYIAQGTNLTDWKLILTDTSGTAMTAKGTPILADQVLLFDSANSAVPVVSTWTQIIAALNLVTTSATGIIQNPKSRYAVFDAGTKTGGTYQPADTDGNLQKAVNGGAFTLGVPANPGTIIVEITNNASAGTITTAGFTKVTGDALTTVNGAIFRLQITKFDATSHLNIVAMS